MPPSLLETWALPASLLAIVNIAATWYNVVSSHVPDPYLDEVFHVPQAQRYCTSDFSWDPKITTPPGLYLVSLLLESFLGCSTSGLRALNAGAVCMVFLVAYQILRRLRLNTSSPTKTETSSNSTRDLGTGSDPSLVVDAHSALNASLFPPLFFFSGLYYTDVVSTLLVLVSYSAFIDKTRGTWKLRDELIAFVIGVTALLFRQTNIFWVAVFPAGLAVIDLLKRENVTTISAAELSYAELLRRSWAEGLIYDVNVHDASLQDYTLIPLSIALAAMRKPMRVLSVLLPYISLLVTFGSFVVWNGGVVLGDKSNHVATIHAPQMLYFWPYVAFFSFPLLLAVVLAPIVRCLPESRVKTFCEKRIVGRADTPTPRLSSAAIFIVLGLAAVHFNTIIHPFTRADNRHYVFYVFRILMRHWAIKYAAVPVYYICAWSVIHSLGLGSHHGAGQEAGRTPSHSTTNNLARQPCQASFILVWLATTALSVITAPLVEPRYFIIPWIIWRLHVSSAIASPSRQTKQPTGKRPYDMRLVLETAWHLAINVVTGYVFLFHGFSWPSEPGKVQRFIY